LSFFELFACRFGGKSRPKSLPNGKKLKIEKTSKTIGFSMLLGGLGPPGTTKIRRAACSTRRVKPLGIIKMH